MIRKVAFYWLVLTLILIDSWLLSKANILGKVGLIIYKHHYLRSFPRALLTVWIVVSISILIVLLVQFLLKQKKVSKIGATFILCFFVLASLSILAKVYIDFTAWSYTHSGLKFRYGAHLLPLMLIMIFVNGLIQIRRTKTHVVQEQNGEVLTMSVLPENGLSPEINRDTSQP